MTRDETDDPPDILDPEDPFLQSLVERSVERYKGVLTPEALAETKEMLTVFLATHPRATSLVRRAKAEIEKGSGTIERRDPAVLAEAERRRIARRRRNGAA